MKRTVMILMAGVSLLAGSLVASSASANTLRVPKQDWPLCSELRTEYCIESVAIQPLGTSAPVALTYLASGVPAP